MRLKSKQARDYRWQTVIKLYKAGKKQQQIAAILELCQSSVSRIIQTYNQNSIEVLRTKPAVGSRRRLSQEQVEQVKSWASKAPSELGFEGEYWSRNRFRLLIEEKLGVIYQVRQVGNILKSLKITLQKPKLKDYRQKSAQVEQWKGERLPAIKKSRARKKPIRFSG